MRCTPLFRYIWRNYLSFKVTKSKVNCARVSLQPTIPSDSIVIPASIYAFLFVCVHGYVCVRVHMCLCLCATRVRMCACFVILFSKVPPLVQVAVWRDLGVTCSYTIEASFAGADEGVHAHTHFSPPHYQVCVCACVTPVDQRFFMIAFPF